MKPRLFRPGVTIPELLLALFVLGLVVAVFVYMLGIQRATSRDAKRVSDVSVLRASLSQFWLQKASYPPTEGVVPLGKPGTGIDKLTGDGIVSADNQTQPVFLSAFPAGAKADEYYTYRSDGQGYSLMFATERPTAFGPAGTYFAHSRGVDQADELK